jgi:hypothetical protein
MGLILVVLVHAANIHDGKAASKVINELGLDLVDL